MIEKLHTHPNAIISRMFTSQTLSLRADKYVCVCVIAVAHQTTAQGTSYCHFLANLLTFYK